MNSKKLTEKQESFLTNLVSCEGDSRKAAELAGYSAGSYPSVVKALKTEIDSLKTVVKGYQKGQTMPNVSSELLDVIKVPTFQNRVELQNGTIVSGDLIEESDSSLTLKTQIGTLVLKKEMVIRMDELEKPGPKVIFFGEPFIDYYPNKQIFSGKIKNVGEIRADFVRVTGKLFDQTTKTAGVDSIFVKGNKVTYSTNVVSDTALKPGETASYICLLYTSPSPRDRTRSRMPSSA